MQKLSHSPRGRSGHGTGRYVAIVATLVFGLMNAVQGRAQAQPAVAGPFAFEVASVTPSRPDAPDGFMSMPGRGAVRDRFTAKNLPLMSLLRAAYGIPMLAEDSRVAGAPAWLRSEKYDVDGKIDAAMVEELKRLGLEQRTVAQQKMLQALLAERCKLTVHRETRDLPIYTLMIAKGGAKLQEAKAGEITSGSVSGPGGAQSITGVARPMTGLVRSLSISLGRPVLDKTGLTGEYDFELAWTPDDTQALSGGGREDGSGAQPDSNASSIFTAIQEQLGLKLIAGKGPVEVVVIDHVERPSAN